MGNNDMKAVAESIGKTIREALPHSNLTAQGKAVLLGVIDGTAKAVDLLNTDGISEEKLPEEFAKRMGSAQEALSNYEQLFNDLKNGTYNRR